MVMKIKINVKKISEYIWESNDLSISELKRIGSTNSMIGDTSVVFLKGSVLYENKSIEFDLEHASLINVGSGKRALFIYNTTSIGDINQSEESKTVEYHDDSDKRFIQELSLVPELKDKGLKLLNFVRKEYGGHFQYYNSPAGYVQRPDNFWTIKVQPRARSLSVSVRGVPNHFSQIQDIEKIKLKEGMNSYSRFNIYSETPLDIVLEVIRKAKKKINLIESTKW